MELLKDEPFALLGINSDGDAETVRKIMAEQNLSWRNAIDGSTSGPWATEWNVSGWPTIYVLDAEGKIRFKGVRGEEMTKAVTTLLDELKGEGKKGG